MSLRDELEHAEVRFIKAVAERDLGYLEEHLAPEFSLTTGRPGHEVRNRAEWLEATATSYVIESFAFAEMDVVDLGCAAIVRSRYTQRGSMAGEDRSQPYLMTDVWKRDSDWRLVSRHVSPL